MGFRNPFRIHVDPVTDDIFMGDYGPDAGSTSPTRGPQGSVEYNIVKEPGFYGWPYCVRENVPYHDITYTSRRGRGHRQRRLQLRRAGQQLAQQHRPDEPAGGQAGDDVDGLHASSTRASPTSGAAARRPAAPSTATTRTATRRRSSRAFYDGQWFIGEWNNDWVKTATWNDDGLATGVSCFAICSGYISPMDIEFGPDGSMYVVEWGQGFAENNPDSGIYRVDYVQGARLADRAGDASRRTAAPCRWP